MDEINMFREVQPDVFWFHPPDGGEVHVVRTDAGLALFDCSFLRHKERLVDAMSASGLDPHDIRLGFITHFHADHAGGMGWWREEFDFPVVAHQSAAEAIETADLLVTGARIPFTVSNSQFVPCPIAHRVEGGECFTVGNRSFEVISAYGHSIGSMHIRADDLLFVGDTIYASGTPGWIDVHWGSNPEDYLETLERMRAYRGSFVLPGHGPPYKLTDAHIDNCKKIVSFYLPFEHGLGSPRVPSQYEDRGQGSGVSGQRFPARAHQKEVPMKAKAVVFREPNVPSSEEIDIPNIQPGEIRMKTLYSGISIGTESSIFSGARTHNGTFPLVGGYMASGLVEEVGPEVSGFTVGERIVAGGSRLDGEINSVWGGHLSMQIVSADNALHLPEKTDMKDAAMYILPRVALNAVSISGINEHDTALIIGQGLIGQFFGQFARRRGAKVIVVEPNKLRAELAREYVTDHVVDPFSDDMAERVQEITSGMGPSVVIEATGSAQNIDSATRFLRAGARMVFLSWYSGRIDLDFAHFHNNGVTAYFPTGAGNQETARAVLESMGNGSIIVGKNLTDVIDHSQACEGYKRLIGGDKDIMGMVIDWGGE